VLNYLCICILNNESFLLNESHFKAFIREADIIQTRL